MTHVVNQTLRRCGAVALMILLPACGGTHWICPNPGLYTDGRGFVILAGNEYIQRLLPHGQSEPLPIVTPPDTSYGTSGQRFGLTLDRDIYRIVADYYDHPRRVEIENSTTGAKAVWDTKIDNPDFISVSPNGSIYLSSVLGIAQRYPPGARSRVAPLDTYHLPKLFNGGDALVNGFAGDDSGTVYFSIANSNAVEMTQANGSASRLEGKHTGLSGPQGIVVDSKGELYVANAENDSVTVYATHASGDVRPLRTIAGDKTGLNRPQAIAVDDDGTVYVFGGPQVRDGFGYPAQTVSVFASRSNGNLQPISVYSVQAGCFTNDHI